jgi:serine/threonine-protein kinase
VSRTDSRRIRLGIIAGAVVLALVAVGTGWWFGVGRYTEAPTLVNLSQPAATARAKDAGITVTFQKRYDEKALANLVFTQTPGPHQRVRRGGTVVATLSLGKERIKVPAVAGRTRADAERAIKAAGLTPKSGTPVFDDKVAKGSVVRTEPGTNQLLARNGAVTLVLSKGVGVDLPNLVGVTKDDAIAKLQQLGVQYTLNEVDNDDPDKAGTVLRQSPSEGPISKDTKVSLDVAPGQATVQVPNLFGKKFSDAKDELEDLGLKVKRDGGGRGEDARVLTQFPLPGTEVAADTEVFVIVG